MRIGIDGGCLANRRGFGRFARQLVRSLSEAGSPHEFVVIVDRTSMDHVIIPEAFESVAVEVREAPSRAASAGGRRGVRDMLAMGRAASRQRLDLMYFPASYSFFPVWNVGKVIVTLHDILALAHPHLVFPTASGRIAWAVKEHAAVRWSDRIVTVSHAARRDLLDWFGLPDRAVAVIPEGPEDVFRPIPNLSSSADVLGRYRVDPNRRFLLYVGGLSPHKNLIRLIEAFARLEDDSVALVIVGDFGDVFHTEIPALRVAVERLGLDHRVNFTGYVADSDLAHLYNRAYALVQPSLMEGFGLPAVEAMACGTPVVSSTAGSLPEVIGNAGVFFEPTNVGDIARAMRDFLGDNDLRGRLSRKAIVRAGQYTWGASARALLNIFEGRDGMESPRSRGVA